VAVAVALGRRDEPLDLFFRQVLAGSVFGVAAASRRNCPFFGGWRNQSEMGICHRNWAFVEGR